MNALDKEINQLEKQIRDSVKDLIKKYVSITSLDIPENDEDEAKKRVLDIVKSEILKIEKNCE